MTKRDQFRVEGVGCWCKPASRRHRQTGCRPRIESSFEGSVSRAIIRVYEGERLPDYACDPKLLGHEDVRWGTGTNTRRVYILDVMDSRYWLTDNDANREPIGSNQDTSQEGRSDA